MVIRLISFVCGALFGATGAVIRFYWMEKTVVHWGIVGLAALVMGGLAALFGKKFWEIAGAKWL